MIASLTPEDYFDLTDGSCGPDVDADVRVRGWNASGHELTGGGRMELTEVDTERLGDGDGDERGNAEPWWFEELDDCVSRMAEAERGELAAYSLASCSPDHGLISVLAWLCKCDAMVWQTVAAEAVGLLANQHAAGTGTASDQAFLGLCEALARVPAKTIDSVLMAAVEAE